MVSGRQWLDGGRTAKHSPLRFARTAALAVGGLAVAAALGGSAVPK